MSKNSTTAGNKSDYLFENKISQESQCINKSVATVSRRKSGMEKKTKKFN